MHDCCIATIAHLVPETHHDCCGCPVFLSRMRYGHCDVEEEAVLDLLRVRVPHLCARKSGKHAVHDLDARVGHRVGLPHGRPTEKNGQRWVQIPDLTKSLSIGQVEKITRIQCGNVQSIAYVFCHSL